MSDVARVLADEIAQETSRARCLRKEAQAWELMRAAQVDLDPVDAARWAAVARAWRARAQEL